MNVFTRQPELTTNGLGPNVKPYNASLTMPDATIKCASYIVCNGSCSHALASGVAPWLKSEHLGPKPSENKPLTF